MEKLIKDMTYKEFNDYCNERACDGRWSMDEALTYIKITHNINSIKVKTFGFVRKKLTEQKREEVWCKVKKLL